MYNLQNMTKLTETNFVQNNEHSYKYVIRIYLLYKYTLVILCTNVY